MRWGGPSALVGRPGRRKYIHDSTAPLGRSSGGVQGSTSGPASPPVPATRPARGERFPPLRGGANAVCWHRGAMQRYEYQVQQVRESMIGGKLSPDKLERLLNDEARKGWRLKAITSADVKGRVGPGGVEGLIITFERPVG